MSDFQPLQIPIASHVFVSDIPTKPSNKRTDGEMYDIAIKNIENFNFYDNEGKMTLFLYFYYKNNLGLIYF